MLAASASPTKLEYWEKSPELWSQITTQRKIIVSAKNEDGRTVSNGAGLVNATVQDVWGFATDPEKIKKASHFLTDFQWNQTTGHIDMEIEVLLIRHRLVGEATKFPDPENPHIEFHVLEGSLVPFTAELEMRSSSAQKARAGAPSFPPGQTLVRISGLSAKDRSLSWPLRVGLEAILQRSAGFLRTAVEEDKAARSSGK